jgi:ABC-type sugar transport system ATPase subunit
MRYGRGSRELRVLHDVSLQLDAGELAAIWGRRRSGRSTLLRVAAGVETPDAGVVRFEGHDLSDRRAEWRRGGIRYCRKAFRPGQGEFVLDQLMTGQLTRGVSSTRARAHARDALERVGARQSAALRPAELDNAEAGLVAIARALVHQPKLLLIDEPTLGVDLAVRDRTLSLLRSLADDGIAVLMSTGETTCLSGADRALSLSKGELRGKLNLPELAPVVPLRTTGLSASA